MNMALVWYLHRRRRSGCWKT